MLFYILQIFTLKRIVYFSEFYYYTSFKDPTASVTGFGPSLEVALSPCCSYCLV